MVDLVNCIVGIELWKEEGEWTGGEMSKYGVEASVYM